MEQYTGLNSLKQFGFNYLTGEACGIGMRILFDLNERAIDIWESFTRTTVTSHAWNDGKASIMLPHSIGQDLWIFAHILKGTKYVFFGHWVGKNDLVEESFTDSNGNKVSYKVPTPAFNARMMAFASDDEERMSRIKEHIADETFYVKRWYKKSDAPGTGVDNQHAMSGRIV